MTDFLVDDDDDDDDDVDEVEPPAFNEDDEDHNELLNQPPSESLMSMMLDSTPRVAQSAGTNFSRKKGRENKKSVY